MKPILHILGLGSESMDKLSLKNYKLLQRSDYVYVLSLKHPVAAELFQEGINCRELLSGSEDQEKGPHYLVQKIIHKITDATTKEQAVLALPGFPLRESRLVKGIEDSLADRFEVNVDGLSEEGSLEGLLSIMAELRSSWGCPWDQEQTHDSLKKYLIEETYEVIDAIDTKNMNNLCEELGDLLLQIVFHARVAEENKVFRFSDVVREISEKMVRRHPHVFGSVKVDSSQEVLVNWEAIKKNEKLTSSHKKEELNFFPIPKGLPALQLAEEVQKKAAKAGFDWKDYEGPLAKIHEEITELENEIGDNQRVTDELGDLLFSIVNLSRFLGVNAEESLRQGTRKFQSRFNSMVTRILDQKLDMDKLSLEEMDIYWNEAKKEEKYGTFGSF